jgi:hypothetical protein
MRRLAIGSVAIAVVLFASGLSAQGKPNFAGKWTLQADPNAAPAGGGGGGGGGRGQGRGGGGGGGFCGMECTITQDAATIKIERMAGQNTVTSTYKLDGSDSVNQQAGRGGAAPVDVHSKAAWDGNKLTITSVRDMGGNSVTTKTTVSMDGANMVVENSFDMGQGPQTTKQTYKKG